MGQVNFERYEKQILSNKVSERRKQINGLKGHLVLIEFSRDMGEVEKGTLVRGNIRCNYISGKGIFSLEGKFLEDISTLDFNPNEVNGIYRRY